ncbi:MAG: serine hydrolase [Candidatus Levybacteria bacterium]|nr:serine hydrolase [Candidatus Levybacteria bacterium]
MKKIILLISCILIGFLAGFFANALKERTTSIYGGVQIRQGGYAYINPLLECDTGKDRSEKKIAPFKNSIEKYVNHKVKEEKIGDIAIYFRDLNNGLWFGINEDYKFTPASLLKLPLLIAYYKKAEQDNSILKQSILFADGSLEQIIRQNIRPTNTLTYGQSYTIDNLIKSMIVYSDNLATQSLLEAIDSDFYNRVYEDMRIAIPDMKQDQDYMSVKEYASFFRMLFNGSYLTKEFSDRALRLLAQVRPPDGIKGGVPKNIVVAHKFGERSIENSMTKQFHDCGIVYYPYHPYLLCIMTRGEDISKQENAISEISHVVYQEVDSLHMD